MTTTNARHPVVYQMSSDDTYAAVYFIIYVNPSLHHYLEWTWNSDWQKILCPLVSYVGTYEEYSWKYQETLPKFAFPITGCLVAIITLMYMIKACCLQTLVPVDNLSLLLSLTFSTQKIKEWKGCVSKRNTCMSIQQKFSLTKGSWMSTVFALDCDRCLFRNYGIHWNSKCLLRVRIDKLTNKSL